MSHQIFGGRVGDGGKKYYLISTRHTFCMTVNLWDNLLLRFHNLVIIVPFFSEIFFCQPLGTIFKFLKVHTVHGPIWQHAAHCLLVVWVILRPSAGIHSYTMQHTLPHALSLPRAALRFASVNAYWLVGHSQSRPINVEASRCSSVLGPLWWGRSE